VGPVPPPGAPPALSAFVRGVGRRALLFTALLAGDGPAADAALARALARFVPGAKDLPMGRWPPHFWKALIGELTRPGAPCAEPLAIAGLEALPPPGSGARLAMLLALVAGLDEEDGAAALGVDAAAWRHALRRAAPHDAEGRFDEAAWRVLALAVRDALRTLPEARLAWWDHAGEAALAASAGPGAGATPAAPPPGARARRVPGDRRLARRMALVVAACALALAATFVPWRRLDLRGGDAGPAPAPGPAEAVPLAPAAAPAKTYDAAFALRHHPDLPRLLAGEDGVLRAMDFGAWYAARHADAAKGAKAAQAAAHADAADALAPAAMPAEYAARPLPAFDAMDDAQRAELQRRAAASDALPREARGALRERWEAWQRLAPRERDAVRAALAAHAALPEAERRALRAEFDALPGDQRHGWLLGPALGARWPRLAPLLQHVPAAQREPLLARLRAMDETTLAALELQAQRTPPQGRDALRRALIGAR